MKFKDLRIANYLLAVSMLMNLFATYDHYALKTMSVLKLTQKKHYDLFLVCYSLKLLSTALTLFSIQSLSSGLFSLSLRSPCQLSVTSLFVILFSPFVVLSSSSLALSF